MSAGAGPQRPGPRIALLANPESGDGKAGDAAAMLASLGARVSRYELSERDAAVASAPERIAVAGGDGSVGCAAEAAARAGVPLAVIPVGTANDFARALELPDELEAACELAVRGTSTRRLELGWMERRPFVNAASAGLSPLAARKAHGLKRALGPLAYAVGALRAGLGARPVRCRVECDGEPLFEGRAWQVTVGATGAFGGGAGVEADPRDGSLDVVVIEARSRARLILHAYGLRAGHVERQRGALSARAREVIVETEGGGGFNVDGELVEGRRFRFTAEPGAYEVVVG